MSSELVCNFCGKQFSSETLLNDLNRDVHTKIESPCNLCDKSFRSKTKLRYHITKRKLSSVTSNLLGSNALTILRQTVTWGPTIKEYMKRNQPGNESIWDKARLSNKWQKDDDPKYQEETAEYDGAPQQVWLEINILMYNNRFYLVKALDPSLIIVRMKTDILIHWF